MKRLLSLTLSAALLAALALPAAAEESAQDARLANVTALVKETLALDTGAYETFRGSLSEDLVPLWSLSWEGDRRSLSVQALEDGAVVSFSRWESGAVSYRGNAFPTFPKSAGGEDRTAAEAFLARALRAGETVELKTAEGGLSLGESSGSAWSGTIALNGLPSPLHYSIRVENGQVTQFDRDAPETSGVGGVPSPEAPAPKDKADVNLKNTLRLNLEYVWNDAGDKAVLRYAPEADAHEFLADAKTGELIDLTELEENMGQGVARASGGVNGLIAPTAKEEMAAGEADLTQAEQEGVRQLEGVLPPETLDKALRAESAYGLRGYALTGSAYSLREENGKTRVLCALSYARTDDGRRLTRTAAVDAKTGDLDSVWSSAPYDREKTLTKEAALKKAEAFLKAWRPDWNLTLHQTGGEIMPRRTEHQPYWQFTFVQTVNGLPFRDNAVYVGIDGSDGSLYSLSSSWDENVTFDSADGLASMETALAAWAETYDSVLAYRSVPRKLAKPKQGMEYARALRLTYGLERTESYEGVDAKTGALVSEDQGSGREPLTYDDLTGNAADIEKLARYGAGYAGGRFRPEKRITQWDLAALVYSLQGAALEPEAADRDIRDSVYWSAYRQGLLRASERDDGAVLSRGDVVRMLLNAAGYGPAARLGGIYTCGYADKDSIPAEDLGYAAMAQALGLASGTYAGSRAATRGEAASMLCRLLERTP